MRESLIGCFLQALDFSLKSLFKRFALCALGLTYLMNLALASRFCCLLLNFKPNLVLCFSGNIKVGLNSYFNGLCLCPKKGWVISRVTQSY